MALFLFQFNCQSQQIKILSATASINSSCASQAYQNTTGCSPFGWMGSVPLKTNGVDWIQFDLGSTFNVIQINITVTIEGNGSNFCGFTIQGSNNGSSYTTISTLSNISFTNNIATLTINTYSPCRYIKLTNFLYCNIPGSVPVYFSNVSIYGIATQSFNSIFVTGTSFLEGKVGIGGAPTNDMLFVNGATAVNNILSVTGATTLGNTLSVKGNITASGNVNIGCSGTSAVVNVNGTIHALKVIVTKTPCSDYVFEPTYKLESLPEIEKYVKENKHLPEIPSAKEFKEKGCDVSEMDDMLLKKIEEITLLMIEQNKRIEALEKENATLKTTK